MTWKLYGSAWKCFGRNKMTECERQNMCAAFVSLNVSFVREDFPLLEWKEAWLLLLPKIDDNHLVT